jgi:hypothetical protein
MIKRILVILRLKTDGFQEGARNARRAFSGFIQSIPSGIAIASLALQGLQAGINLVSQAFHALGNIIRGVKTQLIDSAVAANRQEAVFKTLTGSAEQAAEMMEFLKETSFEYGAAVENLAPSAQQIAVALRAQFGEVDTTTFERLTLLVLKFQRLRPDVPLELWGRAISGLMAGDTSTLTRLLDINVRQIQSLSEEAKAFLTAGEQATEQQLGAVTRLGEESAAAAGDALDVLFEIAEAVGATDDLLDATTSQADILNARIADLKTELGQELLPIYETLLEKALEFFSENEDEIDKFIDNVGNLAQSFADWISGVDTEKIVEDIKAMAKNAGEFGGKVEKWFKGVNWDEVVGTLEQIWQIISDIAKFMGDIATVWDSTFGSAGDFFEGIGEGKNLLDFIAPNLVEETKRQHNKDIGGRPKEEIPFEDSPLMKFIDLLGGGNKQNVDVNLTITPSDLFSVEMWRVSQDAVEENLETFVQEMESTSGNTDASIPPPPR